MGMTEIYNMESLALPQGPGLVVSACSRIISAMEIACQLDCPLLPDHQFNGTDEGVGMTGTLDGYQEMENVVGDCGWTAVAVPHR